MKSLPQSASELRNTLQAIFPSLPADFASSGESVFADAGPTYHSVMREFAYFFAKDVDRFTDRQLRKFAELVARALAAPGALGNAIDTCFLEHARQLKIDQRLEPFLSAVRKEGGR
ncbi:hypothetical protein [Ramlibacter tataouinensis]|uniref:Uncharacterized protein n=1 Tax=Ramlibacter tataouinensis (strain ATCC BAA-407 / DSM 14655 / LMG 21543 / TTB310) TaxID=365046 RepID=F5XY15_RAMTT|nr:hypothetical protein [Ramlibacter tataouinensis]AEG94340.1 hypothetical protein Rta_32280 [Ramlibacter tataouinensis TTB310]